MVNIGRFCRRVLVLVRKPRKLCQYVRYLLSRGRGGCAVARIGGLKSRENRLKICASSFSEYLSIFGLKPTIGELNLIERAMRNSMVAFDIGANVGLWTTLMSRANPNAMVHSFEPNPAAYDMLQCSADQNACKYSAK